MKVLFRLVALIFILSSIACNTQNASKKSPDSEVVENQIESNNSGSNKMASKVKGENIESLPTKNIADIAATSAGVSVENGAISIRGSRKDATIFYVDGIRVNAENAAKLIPQAQIEARQAAIFEDSELFVEEEIGVIDSNQKELTSGDTYDKPEENKFVSPVVESHSTFSLDVDKASYSNVRRFINNGQLPPPAAVRVEELINYFDYNYAPPSEEHPIAIQSSNVTCPWNEDHQLLHLSVKAQEIDTKALPASNLIFLLDVSGSMGDRLPLVIESFKLLLDNLRPQDRVAIVTYAGSDRIALPSTTARDKKIILQSLENLKSGGSTAGAQGILTAYKLAEQNFIKGGNNRVILATDGDFNVGVSSTSDLEQLITEKRETGVFLSVLGFGRGNYQDHKMQTLANKGNGNHAYIDNLKEAKKVFVNEFGGTLFTVAKDVKVQIEFNPAYVQSYRLIGYENRMLAKEDFNDDKKDAGEVGAGHTVTAIYEIIPVGSDSEFSTVVSKEEWAESRTAKQASLNGHLGYIKCRYKQPDADKSVKFDVPVSASVRKLDELNQDVQFSIAVAEFGMNVGQSSYLKSNDLTNCIKLAQKNIGLDTYGYRKEFLELAKSVKNQGLLATK